MTATIHEKIDLCRQWLPELPEAVIQALADHTTIKTYAPNEKLFNQGDEGDALYILFEGNLSVIQTQANGQDIIVQRLNQPGTVVGEMALVMRQPRTATVVATTPSELFVLPKAAHDKLAQNYPIITEKFSQWLKRRLHETQTAGMLLNFFGDLDVDTLHKIQKRLEWLHLQDGDILFKQGDMADGMYLVVNGRLAITKTFADGTKQFIGEVPPGGVVGEFALLVEDVRAATVAASRDTQVAKFTPAHFEELMMDYPRAMLQIARQIIRQQQTNTKTTPRIARALSFTILPLGHIADLPPLITKLTQILTNFGTVLVLNAQTIDDTFNLPGIAQAPFDSGNSLNISNWLDDQEQRYDYILYLADPSWSVWTQRCLRSSDRYLLLAQADQSPARDHFENSFWDAYPHQHPDLILIHDDHVDQPRHTSNWLQSRHLLNHHHVRRNNNRDWQRLGRRLTGRAIGLVLGGGGVKAYCQLGTMIALEEAGIPIDMVGGVSMGSLVGGTYALGLDKDGRYDIFRPFSTRRQLLDWTFPVASFFTSRKVTDLFKMQSRDIDVEDMLLPFFTVSTNLSKAKPMVHRTGPLWFALRASMSLPAAFLPVAMDGDILVDGSVMNNLPIDIMLDQMGAAFTVAVNNSEFMSNRHYDYDPYVSGWQLLWQKINPWAKNKIKVPSLIGQHMRTVSVNFLYHGQSIIHRADVLINPDVSSFGLLEFEAIDRVIDVGYHATKQALQEWRQEGGQLPEGVLFK
ncbi:MAG TPA: cyclic nucleotide-binding and patatin-like phospholipase domain-containing protein [Anaerolineae bacterium]|nr:cyclic nucleotide-binding and patatin-like phospholipase domain-containing protein [Anaerolineae bacterium]